MSWLELGYVLASKLPFRPLSLRNTKSELLDSFGKCVHDLLLDRLSGSSHGRKSMTGSCCAVRELVMEVYMHQWISQGAGAAMSIV